MSPFNHTPFRTALFLHNFHSWIWGSLIKLLNSMIVESCLVFTHDATCVTHSRVLANGCPHAIYVHNSQQHINGPTTLYSHVINAHNSVYPINGIDSALGRELWNRHIVIMSTLENQWYTGVHFKGPCIEKNQGLVIYDINYAQLKWKLGRWALLKCPFTALELNNVKTAYLRHLRLMT